MKRRRLEIWVILSLIISINFMTMTTLAESRTNKQSMRSKTILSSELEFSTYLGGRGYDFIRGMAIDSHGDIYIAGNTESVNFPTTSGAYDESHNGGAMEWLPIDAFVMKLSGDGQEIIYSTFLGGSGDDYIFDIVVDDLGNAYVAGRTDSSDFPTVNAYDDSHNSGEDCFVAKLSSNGSELLFSTYVGGSDDETPYGIAIDDSGDCVVVGDTFSPDFPVGTTNTQQECHSRGGTRDGFVFKLSEDGSKLNYSMYLGASDKETAYGVAIGSQGETVIVGYTTSTDFPMINPIDDVLDGGLDCFISEVNSTGHLIFSTLLGGSDSDRAYVVSISTGGTIYIAGSTGGAGFPIVNVHNQILNGTRGIFLLIMEKLGQNINFSGILVNSSSSSVDQFTVVSEYEVWIGGTAGHSIYPLTEDTFDKSYKNDEGYFSMIDPVSCTLNYSSFFGGGGDDYMRCLVIDSSGVIGAGHTYSNSIPIKKALEPEKIGPVGDMDGFVFKLKLQEIPTTWTLDISLIIITSITVGLVILIVMALKKR